MRAIGLFGLFIPETYGGLGLTMEEEVRSRCDVRVVVCWRALVTLSRMFCRPGSYRACARLISQLDSNGCGSLMFDY